MILNLDSLNIEGYEMGESNSQKNTTFYTINYRKITITLVILKESGEK